MPSKRLLHRGHAYCGLCVPHFLHEQFVEQLGPHASEFDLLSWYVSRDKQRKLEMIVVEEPLTWWRDAFIAELRFRGWSKPREPKAAPQVQKPLRQLKALDTFGRTAEQTRRNLEQLQQRMADPEQQQRQEQRQAEARAEQTARLLKEYPHMRDKILAESGHD